MTMIPHPSSIPARPNVPGLDNGDRMSREEFHKLYEHAPKDFRAELIGGIVYVASPLRRTHGIAHPSLSTLFFIYQGYTPGVEVGDNATILLGEDGEPQPDLYLRILPEFGGQSRTTDKDYIEGPPELIGEIALSSRAIDLHVKRDDYTRYGVLEYLVFCPREPRLYWFDLRAKKELQPDPDGIIRIRAFPGLWINSNALLAQEFPPLMAALQAGLQSSEHAAFVQQLASRRSNASNEPRS